MNVPFWCHTAADVLPVEGPDGLDFLNRMSTAELAHLPCGQARATVFTTEKGRIRTVAFVFHREPGQLEILCPEGAGEELVRWLRRFCFMERLRFRALQRWSGAEVHGSGAHALVERLGLPRLNGTTWGAGTATVWEGIPVRCFRIPSYATGEAYRLLLPEEAADTLRKALSSALGEPAPPEQVGAARILSGIGAPGAEWSEEYNPFEVGLAELVSLTKGCYIGQEVLARLDTYGKVQRCLVRLHSSEPIPAPAPLYAGEQQIGTVTSSAYAAALQRWVALAVVRRQWAEEARFVAELPTGRVVLQRYMAEE